MCLKTVLEYIAKCIAKLLLILLVLLGASASGVFIVLLGITSQDDTEEVQWIPLISLFISFALVTGALCFVLAHKLWPGSKEKQPILPVHNLSGPGAMKGKATEVEIEMSEYEPLLPKGKTKSNKKDVITVQPTSIEIEMSEIKPSSPTKEARQKTRAVKKEAGKKESGEMLASSSPSPKRASKRETTRDKKETPRKESVSVKTSELPSSSTQDTSNPISPEGKKKTGKRRVHWALASNPQSPKEATREPPVAIEMSEIRPSSPASTKVARQKIRVVKKEAEKQEASKTPASNSLSPKRASKGKTKRSTKGTTGNEPVSANVSQLPSASSHRASSQASSEGKKKIKKEPASKGASNVTYLAFTSVGKEKPPEVKPEEKREEISPAGVSFRRKSF